MLASATLDTHVHELGLGTRATNALDRANLLTVEDLLTVPLRRLSRFRGVGNKTRREIITAVRLLRERLGARPSTDATPAIDDEPKIGESLDPGSLSIDLLAERLLPKAKADRSDKSVAMIRSLLGLNEDLDEPWPSQTSVAEFSKVTRARIGQVLGKFQDRWSKEPAITRLRTDLRGIVESAGGAMTVAELAEALVVTRGCVAEEPLRTRLARSLVRAAVEVERSMGEPRLQVRRDGDRVLVALSQDLAATRSASATSPTSWPRKTRWFPRNAFWSVFVKSLPRLVSPCYLTLAWSGLRRRPRVWPLSPAGRNSILREWTRPAPSSSLRVPSMVSRR